MRNDLRQLMEIAQQLEPYVRTSEMEHPRSTKMSAADLLSSSKGHVTNQQIGNAATTFSYTPTKQESRKHQSDAMEFSSGSQFSSSAPLPSIEGSSQAELSEEYKRRSVFIDQMHLVQYRVNNIWKSKNYFNSKNVIFSFQ